ncbi:site-specific integrase [Paenibacillus sp. LjRoot56]|uniref:site-specific integrase n=1 Tax=Paenibacillus sp. LjRoot56 TaxID=3342333 RepID=UPI003ED0802C
MEDIKFFDDLEDIEEFNEDSFNVDHSIRDASLLLEELNERPLSMLEFDDNIWIIEDDFNDKRIIFDFSEIVESLNFLNKKQSKYLIIVIKCWTTTFLSKYVVRTAQRYFSNLKEFIIISHCFNQEQLYEVERFLKFELDDLQRYNSLLSVLNFLDYYDLIDPEGLYSRLALELKIDLKLLVENRNIRSLPPSHEVMIFAWVLQDYWSTVLIGSADYLRYLPVYFWWILTNLIPLRPSEFCHIEKNCLSMENGRYYIRLPRKKQKKRSKKHIQIVDKISIPEDLYNEINLYLSNTEQYEMRSSLLSYEAIPSIRHDSYTISKGLKRKINPHVFSRNTLSNLVNYFYYRVVYGIYGFTLNSDDKWKIVDEDDLDLYPLSDSIKNTGTTDISRKIRPGDTRHFAFLNLMRQGYHPMEIARLGGHTNIGSQYHYHQHAEYWVDTEVLQLMTQLKVQLKRDNQDVHLGEEYKNSYIFAPGKDLNTKIPLEIGFCTDPDQFCQVSDCCLCNAWRISPEEFVLKAAEIEKRIIESELEVNNLIKVLKHLHGLALGATAEEFSEEDHFFNLDLTQTSKQLDFALSKHVRYISIKNATRGEHRWKRRT